MTKAQAHVRHAVEIPIPRIGTYTTEIDPTNEKHTVDCHICGVKVWLTVTANATALVRHLTSHGPDGTKKLRGRGTPTPSPRFRPYPASRPQSRSSNSHSHSRSSSLRRSASSLSLQETTTQAPGPEVLRMTLRQLRTVLE
jgi:hypothetical protein